MTEQDDLINVIGVVKELEYIAKEKELNIDCWKLYDKLHNEHKQQYGSFAQYENTSLYKPNMDARYDYVIENINCIIENKLELRK